MKDILVELILLRLKQERTRLVDQFRESKKEVGVRYFFVNDLLPAELAERIYNAFPSTGDMRLMNSFREKKYTSKQYERHDPLMKDITFALQHPEIVSEIEQITGIINQLPDKTLYAGGLSVMGVDHFLGPHIDNSHDAERKNYRTLNLLYYVSPGWGSDCGGNLELWNTAVTDQVEIVSGFNRLVVMETNPWSWHSVNKVKVDRLRCCVSNYYFSPQSPIGRDYYNVTSFSARPEQRIRRIVAWVDGKTRQAVRWLVPKGLGKKDIFEGPAK